VLPETEGHSLIEIEKHFKGIKKLPGGKCFSKRRKISTTTQTSRNFDLDLEHWKSNEIFEQHLQKINQEKLENGVEKTRFYCPKHNKMGVKKHREDHGPVVSMNGIDNPNFSRNDEITRL
jgi:hypothetical protein